MGSVDISFDQILPSGPHTHTVVFLHGRGDEATKFKQSLTTWQTWLDSKHRNITEILPSIRWVFPRAPLRKCARSPDVIRQWFDVWNVTDFSENEELQAVGLKEIVPEIRRILKDEAALLGGRWDRVILAGISMGAATGVHVLFNLDIPATGGGRLAAFMGFSCRCPFSGRDLSQMRRVLALGDAPENNEVIRNTPVLLEHCVDDPLVLVQNGRKLRDTLRGFGAEVEWKEYPLGGHWFHSPTGLDDVVDYLKRHVVGSDGAAQDSSNSAPDPDAMDLS